MEARQTTRQPAQTAASARRLNPVVVAIIAIAAVTIALVAIVVSTNNTPVASLDAYDNIQQSRLADGGFVIGSPDAPITIVEFADFACPHCQDYSSTMKQLVEDYVATGMARLEYRMFVSAADPVYGPYTAQLAECAENQREGAAARASTTPPHAPWQTAWASATAICSPVPATPASTRPTCAWARVSASRAHPA